jgi:hypothetical protein
MKVRKISICLGLLFIFGITNFAMAQTKENKEQIKSKSKRRYEDPAMQTKRALEKYKAEIKNGTYKPSKLDTLKGLERHKLLSVIKGSHKIDINPITPKDGVKTGLIIAYGHVIKPPYKIYYEGDNLMINNVQVQPSLVRERDRIIHKKKSISTEERKKLGKKVKLREAAQKLYINGLKTKLIEEVQDEITELILKSSDVYKDPIWISDKSIELKIVGSELSGTMIFQKKPIVKKSPEAKRKWHEKRTKEMHESMLKSLKSTLETGYTLIFFSSGGYSWKWDFRHEINKIMGEKGLKKDEYIERIHEAKHSYGLAIDIVENYSPEEWTVEK